MRLQNCGGLARSPEQGTWYRAISTAFLASPLAFTHTATRTGRFHHGTSQHPGVPVLYLTEDPQVALFEVRAMLGSPLPGQAHAPNPNPQSWTMAPVAVSLQNIADLTQDPQLQLIDASIQELTGDWLGYGLRPQHANPPLPYRTHVPTQQLAAALHSTGMFEGFLTYSAVVPTRRNLVVFPTLLQRGSRITCQIQGKKTHRILGKMSKAKK